MANRKRDAGREALEKKGWWRSHRWLVLRRLCQFFVLGMFLSGPWFGVWILHGNYSSSLLFDTVPLTDPLMTLQSLASGHLPATVALTGAELNSPSGSSTAPSSNSRSSRCQPASPPPRIDTFSTPKVRSIHHARGAEKRLPSS